MHSVLPFLETVFSPTAVASRNHLLAPPTAADPLPVAARAAAPDRLRHPVLPVRAAWVSDTHLGTSSCQAEALVGFLEHIRPERLYFNGDIVDMWKLGATAITKVGRTLQQQRYAPAQLTVLKKILRLHDKGTQIVYVPGNHDEVARDWHGMQFGALSIRNEVVHQTGDGRQLLVQHGDIYDHVVRNNRLLSIFGTHAKELVTRISLKIEHARQNVRINRTLEKFGLSSHWSLALAMHDRMDGMNYNQAFEDAMRQDMSQRNAARAKAGLPPLDGITLGHTHIPDQRDLRTETGQPFTYYNSGDWVDARHCTALLENQDGKIHLVRWDNQQGIVDWQPKPPAIGKTSPPGSANTP